MLRREWLWIGALVTVACAWCVPVAFASSIERGFERVSPQLKGADVEFGGTSRAAVDGSAVAYQSVGNLDPQAVSRALVNQFHGARSTSLGAWVTTGMNPPLDPLPTGAVSQLFEGLSDDVSRGVAPSWGLEMFGRPQMGNLWLASPLSRSFELLSKPTIPFVPEDPARGSAGNHFAGASDDFSHIVLSSARRLIAEAPVDVDGFDAAYLYEWIRGQGLRLVNFLPQDEGGMPAVNAEIGYGLATTGAAVYPGEFAVSGDGERVFFSVGGVTNPARELYVREGGIVSERVSASERTDCAGDPSCGGDDVANSAPDPTPTGAQFQLASQDGSVAVFAARAKLTDDATAVATGGIGDLVGTDACAEARCDLYRWDSSAPVGSRLTDLTTQDPSGAGVVATVGSSTDANRVYFVASGVLAAGATEGEPNLYLWEEGREMRFITKLAGSPDGLTFADDGGVWAHRVAPGDPSNHGFRGARVSADGRFLVFRSRARVTGYDNHGTYQVYRFNALSGELVCISCDPRTDRSHGDAFLKRRIIGATLPSWLTRNISSSGEKVFFDSSDGLVPRDLNGRIDVYEWSAGSVRLVSSGTGGEDSAFVDASESGDDVFFTTRDRLARSDTDDLVDIYDARLGDVFEDPPLPVPCVGAGCHGAPAAPPQLAGPATGAVQGDGDATAVKPRGKPVKCKRGTVKKRVSGRGRCVKKHKHKRRARGGVRREGRSR